MSPRKVDKNQKRKEIALACVDMIHDVGIKNITVAQVAKTAGIGKGTVYEYFENKDDIVFEIINIHIKRHNDDFQNLIKQVSTVKDKLKIFFRLILDDSSETQKQFNGYKDFLSIVLADENHKMKEFNCNKNDLFNIELYKILKEGVDKKELKPEILGMTDGLITYQKGLALRKMTQNEFDAKASFNNFIDVLFKLVEVKR